MSHRYIEKRIRFRGFGMILFWKHVIISQEETSAEISLNAQPEVIAIVSQSGL